VAEKAAVPIAQQMREGMEFLRRRYEAEKFYAYFQPFSNTYSDVATLKARYDAAVNLPDVVGLSIGTRPDCVPNPVLDLVQSYTDRLDVWLEYGIQSVHDRTLRAINRGHLYADFVDAIQRTKGRGIKICAHVILGLPGERWDDMMETAQRVSRLGLDGIKIHHLYVARNTPMEAQYARGEVKVYTLEEWVPLVADFLERLSPSIAVQRLIGDTHGSFLVAPIWNRNKSDIFSAITEELRRRETYQGSKALNDEYPISNTQRPMSK
jgi:radical SAM protein (TIGR01212 family)